MQKLINALKSQKKGLFAEAVYTVVFSVSEMDEEHNPVVNRQLNTLPLYNPVFGTLRAYAEEGEAKKVADDILGRCLATAQGAGYELRVAPKRIDDEHHEYCAFARIQRRGGAELVVKAKVLSVVPDFDYWIY